MGLSTLCEETPATAPCCAAKPMHCNPERIEICGMRWVMLQHWAAHPAIPFPREAVRIRDVVRAPVQRDARRHRHVSRANAAGGGVCGVARHAAALDDGALHEVAGHWEKRYSGAARCGSARGIWWKWSTQTRSWPQACTSTQKHSWPQGCNKHGHDRDSGPWQSKGRCAWG